MKCNRHTQHIIRLVNINIIGVSTWNYTLVVTTEIHNTLAARYVLVQEIDIIIYAYEIDQISTFKTSYFIWLVHLNYIVMSTHEMGNLHATCYCAETILWNNIV